MSALFPSLHRSPVSEKSFQDTANVFHHVENKSISIVSLQKSPCREQVSKYSSRSKTPPALHRYSSPSFLNFAERMTNMPGDIIFGQGESISPHWKREDEEETGSEVELHYCLIICVKTAVRLKFAS
jgi:hypothetical protein